MSLYLPPPVDLYVKFENSGEVEALAGCFSLKATVRDEHRTYEDELVALNGRGFLSADQHWRISELKKLKLIAKDRMEAMVRQARASAHA